MIGWKFASSNHIWVVKRHQYGISALVSQTSFRGKTTGSVAKCRLFSQATRVSNTNVLEEQLNAHAVTVDMGKAGPADYSKHILRFVGLLSMLCNYFESRLFDHSPKYINASLTGCTGERT